MKKLFFLGLFMFCMMANALEVSFLLDETGSMHDIKRETISGFNEYIQSVKNREEEISFTLVKFNGKRIKEIYKGISIKEVVPLNKDTYSPDDTTPLYDAVAELICKTTQSIEWDSDMPQEGWLRLNDSTTMYIDSGAIQTNAFFDTKIDK